MLEEQTKTIDGVEYRTQQLPAMRAYALASRITKLIAPSLGDLGRDVTLGRLGLEAFGRLEPEDAQRMALEVFAATSAVQSGRLIHLGNADGINTVFTGRLKSMFTTLAWVLEVNFADFIGGALASGSAPPTTGTSP